MSQPKIIAVIPARMGSQRVKRKNLRLINGKPLIAYVTETCKKVDCFNEIYINSESDVFGEFAKEFGVKFYKRRFDLAGDNNTADEIYLDFINNVEGDIIINVFPTSPFLSTEDISLFVKDMVVNKYDTLIAVENRRIYCLYEGEPLNYDRTKQVVPSQKTKPITLHAPALKGWRYENFKKNMKEFGAAYYGGNGNIGYFELHGLSLIDIDYEEDFLLAEAIICGREIVAAKEPQYWGQERNDLYGR